MGRVYKGTCLERQNEEEGKVYIPAKGDSSGSGSCTCSSSSVLCTNILRLASSKKETILLRSCLTKALLSLKLLLLAFRISLFSLDCVLADAPLKLDTRSKPGVEVVATLSLGVIGDVCLLFDDL